MCREWFRIKDHYGIEWVFFLCDPDDPNLNEKDAITYVTLNQVFVTLYRNNLLRTLILTMHELSHIAFVGPGEPPIVKKVLAATDENVVEREEDVVAYLSPKLFTILFNNGFLKFPDIQS